MTIAKGEGQSEESGDGGDNLKAVKVCHARTIPHGLHSSNPSKSGTLTVH